MQTWLVHMRAASMLLGELGAKGFVAFQIVVGGTVLSALVHPWFYALAAYELASGTALGRPASLLGLPFWLIASLISPPAMPPPWRLGPWRSSAAAGSISSGTCR
jgi:hypothetical protein